MNDAQGPPDLTELLAAGERAAFHGRPADAMSALEQAVVLAQHQGRKAEVTAAAWLLGVALAAGGRYGGAMTVLGPIIDAGESPDLPADQRLFSALAAATVASVHRQLGRHAAARETDLRGLALTDGAGEAAFDCRLGLAADAVGLGDAGSAQAELHEAEQLVPDRDEWWRQRVRLDWVRAEIAMLEGRPADAVEAAESAVAGAERARAPRHIAKGLLFLGVAQLHLDSDEAPATLRRAATLAEGLGTLPLVWPARSLLGALLAGADPDESARSLQVARSAVLSIAGDLPTGVREEWLAREDIAALLGAA
ncbi:MAG: hypothetical protein ACJ74O_11245 [Frankiaceae bacterium]